MSPAKALAVAGALGVLALAGCGSSKPSASASSAPSTTAPTGAPAPSSTPAATPTGSTLFATGAVPAVTGAADLRKEPTVAPGSGNPPTELTGKDLVVGTGTAAKPDATVTVQYVGALWPSGKV